MRFSYDPANGKVSIYVKQSEFDLAANGDEYRVFTRNFNSDGLRQFIEGYTGFVKQVCNNLVPEEQIKDIVTMSTYKSSGYVWRSLLDLDYSDESTSFFENLITYGLSVIDQECQTKVPSKAISEFISRKDASRLSLIMTLLNLPSLPEPYKKRKRKSPKAAQKQIDNLKSKLKTFEDKYGFNSEAMIQYYANDKIMDNNIGEWINVYNEYKFLNSVRNRERVADELIEIWDKKV
jgi:hypothetical protein